MLFHVCLRVAFTLTSVDDGSSHSVEAYGEALDPSDKDRKTMIVTLPANLPAGTYKVLWKSTSADDGDSWKLIEGSLPEICCVKAYTV